MNTSTTWKPATKSAENFMKAMKAKKAREAAKAKAKAEAAAKRNEELSAKWKAQAEAYFGPFQAEKELYLKAIESGDHETVRAILKKWGA